ncbi:MAG TPA: hypothetical protein VJZ49_01570 [Syntrophales bacterium]|nr:hypothetical protein [Syntrophales bacterium]
MLPHPLCGQCRLRRPTAPTIGRNIARRSGIVHHNVILADISGIVESESVKMVFFVVTRHVYRLQKVTLSVTICPLQRFKRGYRYGSEIKR